MPSSDTVELPDVETDYFLTVGPIGPSASQRVLVIDIDHSSGTPGADASYVNFGAALTTAATESLANMDTGVSIVSGNPYPGATSEFYGSTTTVYRVGPYVIVGKRARHTLPIPAFTGADRYIVIVASYSAFSGNPVPTVAATIAPYPVPAFQAEWTEHSGAANDYRSFGGALGIAWADGSKFHLHIGSDGGSATTHSIFPVVSDTAGEDQAALIAGTSLLTAAQSNTSFMGVRGMTFTVPFGEIVELSFPLPSVGGVKKWPLFRYVENDPGDIHVSFLGNVEKIVTPSVMGARSRSSTRGRSVLGKRSWGVR